MVFGVRKLKNIELKRLTSDEFKSKEKLNFFLVLDNIRSMNNVGSIFRTADCLGIGKIYLCGITPCPPHREIHKTSLGAENSVEWEYFDDVFSLVSVLKSKNYVVIGLEQTNNSTDIRECDINPDKNTLLVVGNEIDGVSQNVIELCDTIIEIPQFGTKHSFNVAVSTAIAAWELINNKVK
ncbi:MAG: RNA methyltransferase [Bacteroidetes bacterium]|nr:RNA methyltransferase [Bacteroidota bacterium]